MYLLRNALDVVNVWLVFVPGVIVLTDCQSQQPATGRVACMDTGYTQYKTGAIHALFNYTHINICHSQSDQLNCLTLPILLLIINFNEDVINIVNRQLFNI